MAHARTHIIISQALFLCPLNCCDLNWTVYFIHICTYYLSCIPDSLDLDVFLKQSSRTSFQLSQAAGRSKALHLYTGSNFIFINPHCSAWPRSPAVIWQALGVQRGLRIRAWNQSFTPSPRPRPPLPPCRRAAPATHTHAVWMALIFHSQHCVITHQEVC